MTCPECGSTNIQKKEKKKKIKYQCVFCLTKWEENK